MSTIGQEQPVNSKESGRSTFEISGRRRQDAGPGLAKMHRAKLDLVWWPAVDAPLERVAGLH